MAFIHCRANDQHRTGATHEMVKALGYSQCIHFLDFAFGNQSVVVFAQGGVGVSLLYFTCIFFRHCVAGLMQALYVYLVRHAESKNNSLSLSKFPWICCGQSPAAMYANVFVHSLNQCHSMTRQSSKMACVPGFYWFFSETRTDQASASIVVFKHL